jgi:hypothetical protein
MWAFGPVFEDYDEAEEFLTWSRDNVKGDLRLLTDSEFEHVHSAWLAARNVEAAPDPDLRADLDEFVRTSEWVRESDRRAKDRAAAAKLHDHVQELKREAEELERPTLRDYAREGFEESDPTSYREYQADPRWLEDVLQGAISAYVRDNGDAVPAEVVERLKVEIDEENTRRGEIADERQGLW